MIVTIDHAGASASSTTIAPLPPVCPATRSPHVPPPPPATTPRPRPLAALAIAAALLAPASALAQLAVPTNPLTPRNANADRGERPEGGLYIADEAFSFKVAAQRAMRQNPHGQRFFLLAVPPETRAMTSQADRAATRLRQQALASGGVLLVCQRDIDQRRVDASLLVREAVAVRGFPPLGSNELPNDRRYFDDEDRSRLPASNEALRRLRSACT
jgi:hypothetical protein